MQPPRLDFPEAMSLPHPVRVDAVMPGRLEEVILRGAAGCKPGRTFGTIAGRVARCGIGPDDWGRIEAK